LQLWCLYQHLSCWPGTGNFLLLAHLCLTLGDAWTKSPHSRYTYNSIQGLVFCLKEISIVYHSCGALTTHTIVTRGRGRLLHSRNHKTGEHLTHRELNNATCCSTAYCTNRPCQCEDSVEMLGCVCVCARLVFDNLNDNNRCILFCFLLCCCILCV